MEKDDEYLSARRECIRRETHTSWWGIGCYMRLGNGRVWEGQRPWSSDSMGPDDIELWTNKKWYGALKKREAEGEKLIAFSPKLITLFSEMNFFDISSKTSGYWEVIKNEIWYNMQGIEGRRHRGCISVSPVVSFLAASRERPSEAAGWVKHAGNFERKISVSLRLWQTLRVLRERLWTASETRNSLCIARCFNDIEACYHEFWRHPQV